MSTTYLITGANRGLGLALLTDYLARPNNIVIGGVRDPNSKTSQALLQLPKGKDSKLIIVKIENTSETDASAAVELLKSKHGITALDVVIANAGAMACFPLVSTLKSSDLQNHISINVLGPLYLFQATITLLNSSTKPGKFVSMGSSAGSIAGMEGVPVPNAAYGTSKAALNYITRKAHFENDGLIIFSVHPGWVQTEGGNSAAVLLGFGDRAILTMDEALPGLLSVIDGATREKTSGHFVQYDGQDLPW